MVLDSAFMGYIHQCYLDSIVRSILNSGQLHMSISLEEDLTEEDLEYIKKSISDKGKVVYL